MRIPAPDSADYLAILSLSAALNGQAAALEAIAGSERGDEAERACRTLRVLNGALRRHVEAEQTRLAQPSDVHINSAIDREEALAALSGLSGLWGAYHDRWDAAAVCAEPGQFHAETQRLLRVVGQQLALDRAKRAVAD